MKKLALLFSLAALTLLGFSCAKKDNNNTTSYQLNVSGQCVDQNGNIVAYSYCSSYGYGYSYNTYGQCVQTSTGQIVAQNLCQNSGNGMYSCVQTTTGTQVPNQYCLNGSYGYSCVQTTTRQAVQSYLCQQSTTGGGVIQQQCYGAYRYTDGQIYQCGITVNCSGALMTSVNTGQQVQCL